MRLLQRINGEITVTDDLVENIPAYAILSHTWGEDKDEVSLRDLHDGSGKKKRGFKKILFTGRQAARDSLRYFWVDTCCIDKTNHVELTTAINSMFRWYRNAAKCYVYLADVPVKGDGRSETTHGLSAWEPAFCKSRWFTRGWTLQELVAPPAVEFFSQEYEWLGCKRSLVQQIHRITEIPVQVFQDGLITDFEAEERISWAKARGTKREEDIAYCLLGILDVYLPLIYGEGQNHAMIRLREEVARRSGVERRPGNTQRPNRETFWVPLSLEGVPLVHDFVDRTSDMAMIEMHLLAKQQDRRKIVVVHGLGGIGKTQLSIELARRHQHHFSAVFWLDGRSEDTLKRSLAAIAVRIRSRQDQGTKTVGEVLSWLGTPRNSRWLLIFDNVDEDFEGPNAAPGAYDVRRYLPGSGHGSILITTRLARLGQLGTLVRLGNANKQQALAMFKTHYEKTFTESEHSERLFTILDGLPLAIAQAAAFMRETMTSFEEYLGLYNQEWGALMDVHAKSRPVRDYQNGSVSTTWTVSFNAVQQRDEAAANLLLLWAYLDNKDLSFDLFPCAYKKLKSEQDLTPEWFLRIARGKLAFLEKIQLLRSYSLVEKTEGSPNYNIHPVVHDWALETQDEETRKTLSWLALVMITSALPDNYDPKLQHEVLRRSFYSHADRYVRHGMEFLGRLHNQQPMRKRRAVELADPYLIGSLYLHRYNHGEEKKILDHAIACYQEVFGPSYYKTVRATAYLGKVYRVRGELDQAEQICRRALNASTEESSSSQDVSARCNAMIVLARVYMDQGKLDNAKQMLLHALKELEQRGLTNSKTALTAARILGKVLLKQGNIYKANSVVRKNVIDRGKLYGPKHESTLKGVLLLGRLYDAQGKLDEAEAAYRRAIRGYEDEIGFGDHWFIGEARYNLGKHFDKKGDLIGAKTLYSQALLNYQDCYGQDHWRCRKVKRKLAALEIKKNIRQSAQPVPQNKSFKGDKSVRGKRSFFLWR